MWQEYKAFLFRGNLLDLAVAFVLGVAFSGMVTAFTDGLIMNPIAAFFGEPDVAGLAVGPFLVGPFLNAVLSFLVVASALFAIVRSAAKFTRPSVEDTPAPESDEVVLLREIRDVLRQG